MHKWVEQHRFSVVRLPSGKIAYPTDPLLRCFRPELQDPNNNCNLYCPFGQTVYGSAFTGLVTALVFFFYIFVADPHVLISLLQTVLSYIAFVGDIVVIVVCIVNPKLREFPFGVPSWEGSDFRRSESS